jgi:hypothetical protein
VKANEVIEDHSPALSFYFGNRGTLKGIARDGMEAGYCLMNRTPWAVAICLPTGVIPDMLRECDDMPQPQDDVRIGRFISSRRMKVYFPLPSLIDHRLSESLVGDPGRGREAAFFIDKP